MRYASAPAFRDALEQRLRSEARDTGLALIRLRKRVAFERLLARLMVVAPEGWVLKGAFALDVRLGIRTRTTKDIDLAQSDGEQAATEGLMAAAVVDLGDFFGFDIRRTPALDADAGFHAVRYTVVCELAGRRFEQFPVDVALGETPTMSPERLRAPELLSFAGIEAPELPVVALEQHVAEKLHAYTGRYGADERESTRAKDLVDLVLLAELARFDVAPLSEALQLTFTGRARQPLPAALPPPPRSWAEPYAELAGELGLVPDLAAGHAEAGALLDPVLSGEGRGSWDPSRRRWGEGE